MKCSWRSLTAISVLALGVAPANADEWSYNWGGSGNLSAYGIDQDELAANPLNDYGFAGEGKVWGRVKLLRDFGTEFGLRAQLRFQSSEHEFSNDLIEGAPDFVDEVWAYVQTAFGRVTVGLEDGAGDSAGIFSPTVSEINRIDDPRAYPLQDPRLDSFNAFMPNGAHMRTDLNGSGDAFKVIYYSPRLIGVQITGSYTPELSRGLNDLFDSDDQFNEQRNIWEVGLNYQGSLSSFDVGLYAAYVRGYSDNETDGKLGVVARPLAGGAPAVFVTGNIMPDDLEEWGAGGQVAYEGFKFGGSYRVTNIAGGGGVNEATQDFSAGCRDIGGCILPDVQTTVWGAGVTYETGPWRFGVDYVNLEEELPAFTDSSTGPAIRRELTQDAQGWTGAVGYEFDENLQIVGGYQHYDFDGPAGVCTGAACDTLDADLAYVQFSMSFEQ